MKVCTWLRADQKWKALYVTPRLVTAKRAKVECLVPCRTPCPWAAKLRAWHQDESIAQLRACPLLRTLLSCQRLSTSRNNLPAYCTWISTWRTGVIVSCEEQRLILQQTRVGICLGAHWLWIFGEHYGIALVISLFHVCFVITWVWMEVYKSYTFSISSYNSQFLKVWQTHFHTNFHPKQ